MTPKKGLSFACGQRFADAVTTAALDNSTTTDISRAMLFLTTMLSFLLETAFQYSLFLPLDLWTKHAIRSHGSMSERLHIWRSEAQLLAVMSVVLGLWRLRVPWLLVLLAGGAHCSGCGWSPSRTLEAAVARVFTLWFECMEGIGVAVDSGLRKVFPQHWKMEQTARAVLITTRELAVASAVATARFLQRLWRALVRWGQELWEAYLHHADAISVPPEARGAPPRIARRATFSGVVDRMEVTDRVPPER